jgi:N-acetylglucosamine kinase-like BadF-type ATPase
MPYIMAIDGGGTKTHLAIIDTLGKTIYQKIGPGSNHQSADIAYFSSVLSEMIDQALTISKLKHKDIEFCFMGLSGADLPEDFKLLYDAAKQFMMTIPFQIENDAWLVMRSGLSSFYGAVTISGTGTNSAAVNQKGERAILRSLGFTLGIYGGGLDIAREGLHYAFRADEMTYMETMLKDEIPKLLGVKNMSEVVPFFYPKQTISRELLGKITALVMECAHQKDQVSRDILTKIGIILGDQTAGVIKQVQMTNDSVPVVVGGRVFESKSPYLLDAMSERLKTHVPNAYVLHPKYPPVIGAYLLALDHLDIKQSKVIENNLRESWKKP